MKYPLIIFFLLLICFNSTGQSLDTIHFFENTPLITDLSLNDNINCLVTDTSVVLHGCHNFHGEDIVVTYYEIDNEVCDSISSLSNNIEHIKVLKASCSGSSRIKSKHLRLIPNVKYDWPNFFISAEVLFQIEIGNRKYSFSSFHTTYKIDEEDFFTEISISERIPKAFTYFGTESIIVIAVFEDEEVCIIPKQDYFYIIPKSIARKNQTIKQVKIFMRNECFDQLEMTFVVK